MKPATYVCGIILGLKPKKLEIMPVGFSVYFRVNTDGYNKKILKTNLLTLKKLFITLAGPAINLICIFTFTDITIIYINILIFIFNMVTIYPLDGGRILKYILCFFINKINVLSITHIVSNITALLLVFFTLSLIFISKNFTYIFAIVYIIIIVIKENKVYKMKRNMYRILENNIAINKD